jgi:HEAT repeat protein
MVSKRKTVTTPLREEREKRGWTLDFLHACLCALIDNPQKTPISIRQIESWERGEHFPHPYWRHRLCTIYKKSAVELGLVRNNVLPEKELSSADTLSTQKKYLQRLSELYGTIKLPIGPAQGFSLQAVFQPLRLCQASPDSDGRSYQDNYLLQDETIGFDGHTSAQVQQEQPLPREEPSLIVENGDEALKQSSSRKIIVLGGPGTGKSTLLKYFVGNRAHEALKNLRIPLPIFVSLPEFGRSGKPLKSFLLETLQDLLIDDAFVEILWQKIQQGEALICLDSLDEVTTGQTDMIHKINAFLASVHPQTTCVISSRFTDFKSGQFLSSHVMEWELLPLDHSLGQKLAERLLPELQQRMQQTGAGDPKTFLRMLEMHPRIAAWGKNPLLFSLAAILYVRRGQLPESRRELYLQVIDAIIELREPALEWRITLREIFGALAYKLFTERKGRTFSVTDLIYLLRSIRQDQGENWHVEEVARRLRNAGLLEASSQGNFSFLHQTFQEYLAGYHIAFLPALRAEREIDRLVGQIDDPFYRQIIIELAYIVHQSKKSLEEYLYQKIIKQYQDAKMGLLEAQQVRQLTLSSALSGGCDRVLQALVDVWGLRLCATLASGSRDRKADGEVASSIAWVFERNPRPFAVPALIAGLSIYQKRARFLGALGEIGTKEAQEALYTFTEEQLANPTDLYLFRYLASSLGQARVEQAIPLLQIIRDDQTFDFETRFEAHQALLQMGQKSTFDEQSYYQIERILNALRVEDDQHRPSDWKRVANIARWLQANYAHTPALHTHYQTILQALKEVSLEHTIDTARQATVNALGILGDSSTFVFLLQCLEKHTEPVYDVANLMLKALERLVDRQQINIAKDKFIDAFSHIEQNYPALMEEITRAQMRIQILIERNTSSD